HENSYQNKLKQTYSRIPTQIPDILLDNSSSMIRHSTATPDEFGETLRGLVRRCKRSVSNRERLRNVRNCLRRQRVRPVMSVFQARRKARAAVPNKFATPHLRFL